ncbi:Uu.00g132130.m01.CDS01 [Anthostomella pinea]|uniref:Uu.00g132130.m01.CDS01 n=1 Tax=Anthostomella pinea TaxID=933095 RepID=A0AAI8YIB6_9PEZI|nr:Uu.00g132130.m01.CDS01 [Anthostomella pinea]
MSTFNGYVHEFPDIRVDYFRDIDRPPPLAYFLSHVHSDHLAGLETFKSPFIYCSPATRAILLRLKKTACRLNYAKGILENPRMQTYRHLDKVLKAIPLDTPTTLELGPGSTVQVTLLDANHCTGAVMFLFEGDGKAALYTGDIRSEPRMVTATAQNPTMIEYSSGWKTLDRIYLDTSILDDYPLPTKAEGLRELIEKVSKYPKETIFHFQAYEEVWIALSKSLGSKIHVDEYKMNVYRSLVTRSNDNRWATQTHLSKEAPFLVGFTCGNHQHDGCLTLDENARLHSCEKGMGCSVMENKPVVWIQPIVAHLKNGQDIVEVGIGGGGDDLNRTTTFTPEDLVALLQMATTNRTLPQEVQNDLEVVKRALVGGRDVVADIDESDSTDDQTITAIIKSIAQKIKVMWNPVKKVEESDDPESLPKVIRFPYARHSSLPELRHLVRTFKPRDIWPCTVDESWISRGITMRDSFADCCSGDVFEHDKLMEPTFEQRIVTQPQVEEDQDSQETAHSPHVPSSVIIPSTEDIGIVDRTSVATISSPKAVGQQSVQTSQSINFSQGHERLETASRQHKRDFESFNDNGSISGGSDDEPSLQGDSQASAISDRAYAIRWEAFQAMRSNIGGDDWETFGLISTTDHHTSVDHDLGGL